MWDFFPQEIIHEILFRLSIKCLIRCTSVCKSWRSIIKNPTFIRAHLSHTTSVANQYGTHLLLLHCVSPGEYSRYGHHVYVEGTMKDLYSLHYDNHAFDEYCKIEFPIALKELVGNQCFRFRVVGICNGLVCLADDVSYYGYNFIIWNPSIRKLITLPKPNLTIQKCKGYDATCGFGYDAMTNDYKVVILLTDQCKNPTIFEVYSLTRGAWSNPGSVPPICEITGRSPQAFVNGALHWEAFRLTNDAGHYFILAFDVGSELFREIMMPKDFTLDVGVKFRLSASGDEKSIALFTRKYNMRGPGYIWVMREYGMVESWTEVITFDPQGPEGRLPMPLCFRKSGEVVLFQTDEAGPALVSLDLSLQQFKNFGIRGYNYCSVDYYEESLVLLDKIAANSY